MIKCNRCGANQGPIYASTCVDDNGVYIVYLCESCRTKVYEEQPKILYIDLSAHEWWYKPEYARLFKNINLDELKDAIRKNLEAKGD